MTRAKAKKLRKLIEQLAITLDDETALTGVELFSMWNAEKDYAVGDRVQYKLDTRRYTCFMGCSNRRRMARMGTAYRGARCLCQRLKSNPQWKEMDFIL